MYLFHRLFRRNKIEFIIGGVLVTLATFVFLWDKLTPSIVREALPASASEIQEYYAGSFNLNGDFARYLKAKMPESEMPGFATKLGMKQYRAAELAQAEKAAHQNIPVDLSSEPEWWHPSATMDGTYVKLGPGPDSYSVAKYEKGTVYFKAVAF